MGQGQNTGLSSLLGSYTTPLPDIVNQYMQQLSKGGLLNFPSFNELFGSYKDIANREASRQAANINESFGSVGGRYSSDLLGAQSRLRENTSMDLANQAAQYQSKLREQQFGEVSGVANMQYGASEAGMARLFQDFLRRTSPPPGLGALYGLSSQYGLPATVIG